MRTALAIAGSDPTGGAGLQADLQVFRVFGVHGAGVVTALTVQDTEKVHQVLPAFPSAVLDQVRVLVRDVEVHAVKLGMLATDDVARAVELGLDELERVGSRPPLVVDPVLTAGDGSPLLERRAIPTLLRLSGRAALVTPNLAEAEALVGRDVSTRAGAEAAARALVLECGAAAVLLKGGHAEGAPDDLLVRREADGATLRWLEGERIHAGAVHGTGCALASAVAAGLARGRALEEAVAAARRFVADGLRRATAIGGGARILGFE